MEKPTFNEEDQFFFADGCRNLVAAANKGELVLHAIGRYGYPGERIPDNELEGLSSVGVWDAKKAQTWGLPTHRNEGVEFSYMSTGHISIKVDNQDHVLNFGECFITRPWQPHQVGAPFVTAGRLIWLILDLGVRRPHQEWVWPPWVVLSKNDADELTLFLRQNERGCWKISPEMIQSFEKIAATMESNSGSTSYSNIKVWINVLLLQWLELFRSQDIILTESLTNTSRSVQQFLDEVRDTLDRPWQVQSMADACGLGVTQFTHYVKALTNRSPSRYLLDHRMRLAKKLLSETPPKSIDVISSKCGYSSTRYFSSVFSEYYGTTPLQYTPEAEG